MKIEDLTPEQRKWFDERRTKCEVWSRVMGYHRPVQFFNEGKQSEFKERKLFKESIAMTYVKELVWTGKKDWKKNLKNLTKKQTDLTMQFVMQLLEKETTLQAVNSC